MFWIICAILVLIAIAFIFPALRKRNIDQDESSQQNILIAQEQLADLETRFENSEIDEESYQSSRDELEQSLYSDLNESGVIKTNNNQKASSKFSMALILLLIPVISFPIYYKTGNMVFTKNVDAIEAAKIERNKAVPKKPDGTPDIEAMVAGLQQKMDNNRDNAEGWYMLGRSYMVLEKYPEAAKSFERANKLIPDSANVMLSLADSLSMAQQGSLLGRPGALINEALKLEPENVTALWLSGMAARQSGDYLGAISIWNRVLPLIQNAPQQVSQLEGLISEARSKLPAEMQNTQAQPVTPSATEAANEAIDETAKSDTVKPEAEIKVMVSLSEDLKSKAAPDDLVFIYAKAMSGPPMPLAAVRKQVKDLPLEVVLNDEMAMMPSLKMSSFDTVIVGARVSKTGQPISQNGDLYAEKRSIKNGENISIEINEVLVK
ncbi:c-type cytochrome biogenesis protein CcmI [Cocleimonas sp. KMM 6892]|uniref:c-type cytochrome biogenesis protein CcmI n=1 Tax=unclassified Cocleimonas TaxID=2639732 RepID=UPI002DB8E2F5|nr:MULTISPECIES: c-type cytochrome biogenesis protein CcmI [unclassified Cocleimonas]MEB8432477.1 c-type cytochrome biogenesis protein CcmI [Cocleimonas sp. KMM 6892]MEC4715336.1 c-type cytochrome biogenesis protein CcmI [Cocleimonas sp. KMM 6895]MEC4745045.1 c-type cytochrome biogenesis protein CcmI [Cocleimonas sp. KMM 6896]